MYIKMLIVILILYRMLSYHLLKQVLMLLCYITLTISPLLVEYVLYPLRRRYHFNILLILLAIIFDFPCDCLASLHQDLYQLLVIQPSILQDRLQNIVDLK